MTLDQEETKERFDEIDESELKRVPNRKSVFGQLFRKAMANLENL